MSSETLRVCYPGPLTQEDLDAMVAVLPDRPTEEILAWIGGDGPDPWAERMGPTS